MAEPITRFYDEYRWLSNFWMSPVVFDDKMYASVEHAYQANKAIGDTDHLYVALAPTAGKAKRRGQAIEMRPDWDRVKLGVMEACLRSKFAFGTELAQMLVDTGDAELVEGNSWGDCYWGRCNGIGESHLGRFLMKIREELVEESLTRHP